MAEISSLVIDLAQILILAGIVTIVFKKLKQPLILGYIVAGFLVGEHMPYTRTVMDGENIETWAEIGVIFLLFSLGLDFSFKKILRMGMAPVIATCTIIFSMMMLGIMVGHAFGWNNINSIFLGGMLAMSSTTIIYKAFDDMGLRQQQFAGIVMGVLILEDVFAIVLMVMLSAIAVGNADSGAMLMSVAKIIFFLVLWFVVGIFLIPLLLRRWRPLINRETLLIVSLGLCCLMAVLSTQAGFSSAFGAFVMGSILAETVEAEKIIRVVEPVKNLFGAIFFVSVGMMVDPAIIYQYAVPIAVLVLTILLGQAILGTMGFLISGQTLKSAMRCGFSMAQIGEFSFIIATMGMSLGVIDEFLYPVVVTVSVITTFLTPYMIKAAPVAYKHLEGRLPRKWVRRLNHLASAQPTTKADDSKWKKLLMQMAVNTLIYSILSAAGTALMMTFFYTFISKMMPGKVADIVCVVLTILLISPFLRAIVMKKNHSEEFQALWTENRANRLPLIFTVVVRLIIAVGFVYYVLRRLTWFSLALGVSVAICAVVLMIMSRSLQKRSIRLERLFVQNLRSRDIEAQVHGHRKPLYEGHLLDRNVHIADFDVPADSKWAGQTLMQLGLGQRFGVQVSSILRAGRRFNIPEGDAVVFPGDVLQVIGSDDQLSDFGKVLREDVFDDDYELEKREMKLRRMVITGNSPFLGQTLQESGIRHRYNCMVVGIEEGKENLSLVTASYRFEKGDIIWVVGEENSLKQLIG